LGFDVTDSRKVRVDAPPARVGTREIGDIYSDTATYSPQFNAINQRQLASNVPNWMELFRSQINPALGGAQTDTLARSGPAAVSAIRGMNPSSSGLYDTLAQQAATDLEMGGKWRPDDAAATRREINRNWNDRGFHSPQPASDFDLALTRALGSENQRGQRRAFASSIAEQGNQMFTQPALAAINPQANTAVGMNILASGDKGATDFTGQMIGYGSDINNTNFNADAAARIGTANNNAALVAGANSY